MICIVDFEFARYGPNLILIMWMHPKMREQGDNGARYGLLDIKDHSIMAWLVGLTYFNYLTFMVKCKVHCFSIRPNTGANKDR